MKPPQAFAGAPRRRRNECVFMQCRLPEKPSERSSGSKSFSNFQSYPAAYADWGVIFAAENPISRIRTGKSACIPSRRPVKALFDRLKRCFMHCRLPEKPSERSSGSKSFSNFQSYPEARTDWGGRIFAAENPISRIRTEKSACIPSRRPVKALFGRLKCCFMHCCKNRRRAGRHIKNGTTESLRSCRKYAAYLSLVLCRTAPFSKRRAP